MPGPTDDELDRTLSEASFVLTNGEMTVTELGSGDVVDAPGVAARGLNAMTQAVERAGGRIQGSVRLIGPGGKSTLSLVRTDEEDN